MTKLYLSIVALFLIPFTLRNGYFLLDQNLGAGNEVFSQTFGSGYYLITLVLLVLYLVASFKSFLRPKRPTVMIMSKLSFGFQMAVFSLEGKVSHSRAVILLLVLALNFLKLDCDFLSGINVSVLKIQKIGFHRLLFGRVL